MSPIIRLPGCADYKFFQLCVSLSCALILCFDTIEVERRVILFSSNVTQNNEILTEVRGFPGNRKAVVAEPTMLQY